MASFKEKQHQVQQERQTDMKVQEPNRATPLSERASMIQMHPRMKHPTSNNVTRANDDETVKK
jgi:hypothetical protein